MNIFKLLFSPDEHVDLKPLINDGAFLVDVRSIAEFSAGHVPNSVNIPLDIIDSRLSEFKNRKNIIVFCQSGGRSSMAKTILNQHGFNNVVNGGTWTQVNALMIG